MAGGVDEGVPEVIWYGCGGTPETKAWEQHNTDVDSHCLHPLYAST